MSHTTLGLDIGVHHVRYVLCHIDGDILDIKECGSIPLGSEQDDAQLPDLNAAFETLEQKIAALKKSPIDAIGLSLDPTRVLSAHKVMPFNDPKVLEQIIPQAMSDIWKLDENTHIAFEVGEFVTPSDDHLQKPEDEDVVEGYDIYVINYPKSEIKAILDKLNAHNIDPHVALPACNAIPYAIGSIFPKSEATWCLLDIGEHASTFAICSNNRLEATRTLKIGGANFDEALANAFGITLDEARNMKETTGFVALPGSEFETYQHLIKTQQLLPRELDISAMSSTCTRVLNLLLSSIRQSLIQFSMKRHTPPTAFYLTGGGSKLAGLTDWLSQNLGIPCFTQLPNGFGQIDGFSLNAANVAIAADRFIDGNCPLNLRRGTLAHKGSLAFLQDNKWVIASVALLLIAALIFMTVTKANSVQKEHDILKASLEKTTQEIFGKKLLTYPQIEKEIAQSQGFEFIPEKTAFTHFAWISTQVNDNLSDVEMDINSIDIDTQRKIVSIRGEVTGDEGLPKFMQLLEQYECFPNEIAEPKTTKTKDRTSFTLRFDANNCASGGDSE